MLVFVGIVVSLAENNGEDASPESFNSSPEEIGIARVCATIILHATDTGGVNSKPSGEMVAFSSDDAVGPLILVRVIALFSLSVRSRDIPVD